ncbi:hypothetical protein AB1Y20_018722 [Prymnesium parvum]|uniref:peptide-methionine (S)-S-oxide reductase n=1 Tax=Prymnesium parvum TaxID=97485 RepID=A0AB34JP35_PRYPA
MPIAFGVLAVAARFDVGAFFRRHLSVERTTFDYGTLRGLPESYGWEAAQNALAGRVVSQSAGGAALATLAGGCFWGTELHFMRMPGVIATCVGYTQGALEHPTYSEVCTGTTGHTEACQVVYDPSVCSFESLCEKLFETIDPTVRNRVGNDQGTQYRHGIYPHTEEQMAIARDFIARKQEHYSNPIVTEVKAASIFWPAEEYHQQYLKKGGQSARKGDRTKVRCYG